MVHLAESSGCFASKSFPTPTEDGKCDRAEGGEGFGDRLRATIPKFELGERNEGIVFVLK